MSTIDNGTIYPTVDTETSIHLRVINNTKMAALTQGERAYEANAISASAEELGILVFSLLNIFEHFIDLLWQLPEQLYGPFATINAQAGFIRLLWADDAASFLKDGVIPRTTPYLKKRYDGIEAREINNAITVKDVVENVAYAVGVFACVWEGSALNMLDHRSAKGDSLIIEMGETLMSGVKELESFLDAHTL